LQPLKRALVFLGRRSAEFLRFGFKGLKKFFQKKIQKYLRDKKKGFIFAPA